MGVYTPIYMENQRIENNSEKKKFDKIINDMETVIDSGLKVPPMGAVISTKELRKHMAILKKSVNDSVEEAEHIVNLKEKILADAKAEAEEMLRRRQVEISKQPVLKEAENIAKKIILRAKEEGEAMYREAQEFQRQVKEQTYRYADVIFDELDKSLNEKRRDIMQNRQHMKSLIETTNKQAKKEEEPKRKLS
ncbi:hypothetical protein U8V72_10810 [Priestia filamentosa]|uniref:hypothetical protein n=1 Tax=Priestia filamentosa TaxID=1402861 RepID=UPI0005890E37